MPLHLELITPERTLFREEVDAISVPTPKGEITVLLNHAPIVSIIAPGVLRLTKGDVQEDVAVAAGLIEVLAGNVVRIVAESAERGHELTLSIIEEAKARAKAAMANAAHQDDEAYASAAALLERELAREHVARRFLGNRRAPTIDGITLPDENNVS